MNTPTYKEGFDKITTAYFNDELNAFKECACFIGNLLNNSDRWGQLRDYKSKKEGMVPARKGLYDPVYKFYTMEEICMLETNFLHTIVYNDNNENKETLLFEAMDSTLDLLRTIHESKGEIIDTVPAFQKRQLQTT